MKVNNFELDYLLNSNDFSFPHIISKQPEFRCVLETVGPNGEFMDTMAGRLVTPGHAIEAGWLDFIGNALLESKICIDII
jgi:hypothetical protein